MKLRINSEYTNFFIRIFVRIRIFVVSRLFTFYKHIMNENALLYTFMITILNI